MWMFLGTDHLNIYRKLSRCIFKGAATEIVSGMIR